MTTNGRYAIDVVSRMIKEDDITITGKQAAEAIPLSNKISHGGTKPDNRWKIEASKNFTIAPQRTTKSLYGSRQRGYQNSRKESIKCGTLKDDCIICWLH